MIFGLRLTRIGGLRSPFLLSLIYGLSFISASLLTTLQVCSTWPKFSKT
jgi:hypothetical protein